jgi:hypothetical protein
MLVKPIPHRGSVPHVVLVRLHWSLNGRRVYMIHKSVVDAYRKTLNAKN